MTDLSLNLPDKPLKMKGIFANSTGRILAAGIFLPLFAVGLFLWAAYLGKAAYTDYQIGQDHRVLFNADIDGKCKSHYYLVTHCDTTIRDGGQSWEKSFLFFDFSMGKDFSVVAIAANSDPSQVTLDLAAEKAVNRMVVAVVIAVLGIVFLYLTGQALFVSLPRIRALLRGLNGRDAYPWRLTTVDAAVKGESLTHFFADINGTECKITINLGKKMEPWLLDVSGDTARLLAFGKPAAAGKFARANVRNAVEDSHDEAHRALRRIFSGQARPFGDDVEAIGAHVHELCRCRAKNGAVDGVHAAHRPVFARRFDDCVDVVGVLSVRFDDARSEVADGRLRGGHNLALVKQGEQVALAEQTALVGLENDVESAVALLGPRGEAVFAPSALGLFVHQSVTRPRYSPVRVSILTLSPWLRKRGTWTS